MSFFRLLKKWMDMLSGNSIFHVAQGIGKCYKKDKLSGYYNDLTNKISDNTLLDNNGIPYNITVSGLRVYFPITIFQYGLGLYDLYLIDHDKTFLDKFIKIVDWAVSNQLSNGMWNCMSNLNNKVHKTQSSMCQSEGVSILLRAYYATKNEKYYKCATKAINFMLQPVEKGGTTLYMDDDVIFQEYVSSHNLSVLNGWIFSIFGLYDYTLINRNKKYRVILEKTLKTLQKNLKLYDSKYWSYYDTKKTVCSPFYHDLHINQLKVLYDLFKIEDFEKYAIKWSKYKSSKIKMLFAMFIKLVQKLLPNKYYDKKTSLLK